MNGIDRRAWLRQASLLTAGLGLSIGNVHHSQAATKDIGMLSDEVVRLLFNENPYGPSEKVLQRIDKVKARSHRYATFFEYDYLKLKALIAAQEGIKPSQVALGHGSVQPLIWISILHGGPGKEIVSPAPAFDVIGSFGKSMGTTVKKVLVDDQMKLDLPAMEGAVTDNTSLVVIINPNNPTATSISAKRLQEFCNKVSVKCPVCIDEAYIHYLGSSWRDRSMVHLLRDNPNLIITRTFSKIYGMAGLRMGFMIGSEELINKIEQQFMLGFPGNMPHTLSVAAAMAALDDEPFLEDSRRRNEEMKNEIYHRLDAVGWEYVASDANFVYFDTGNFKAFKDRMNRNKILIAGGWPSKPQWGRVTVGNEMELEAFFKALTG